MTLQSNEMLSDRTELLFRQIHPSFFQEGRISSEAFRPTAKDHNRLSVDQGSKTTPETAFTTHVRLGHQSIGVMGVTVGECDDLGLSAYSDPLDEKPAHAFIQFEGLSGNASKTRAKSLRARAESRGFLHTPPS